jgi:predicted O-methyltransferase YrrM
VSGHAQPVAPRFSQDSLTRLCAAKGTRPFDLVIIDADKAGSERRKKRWVSLQWLLMVNYDGEWMVNG